MTPLDKFIMAAKQMNLPDSFFDNELFKEGISQFSNSAEMSCPVKDA